MSPVCFGPSLSPCPTRSDLVPVGSGSCRIWSLSNPVPVGSGPCRIQSLSDPVPVGSGPCWIRSLSDPVPVRYVSCQIQSLLDPVPVRSSACQIRSLSNLVLVQSSPRLIQSLSDPVLVWSSSCSISSFGLCPGNWHCLKSGATVSLTSKIWRLQIKWKRSVSSCEFKVEANTHFQQFTKNSPCSAVFDYLWGWGEN